VGSILPFHSLDMIHVIILYHRVPLCDYSTFLGCLTTFLCLTMSIITLRSLLFAHVPHS